MHRCDKDGDGSVSFTEFMEFHVFIIGYYTLRLADIGVFFLDTDCFLYAGL